MTARYHAVVPLLLKIAQSGRSDMPDYALGTSIEFNRQIDDVFVEAAGWSGGELQGRWSDGPSSMVVLKMAPTEGLRSDLVLTAALHGFTPARHDQRIEIHANGRRMLQLIIPGGDARPRLIRVRLPPPQRALRLDFLFPDCVSPAALGLGDDPRALGGQLHWLMVSADGTELPEALMSDRSVLIGLTPADLQRQAPFPSDDGPPPTALPTGSPLIDFRCTDCDRDIYGFEPMEWDGRWTADRTAGFRLDLTGLMPRHAEGESLFLYLLLEPYTVGDLAPILNVAIGGGAVFRYAFPPGERQVRLLRIGPVTAPIEPELNVVLVAEGLQSPLEAGESNDERRLGIKLRIAALLRRRDPLPAFALGLELAVADLVPSTEEVPIVPVPAKTKHRGAFARFRRSKQRSDLLRSYMDR